MGSLSVPDRSIAKNWLVTPPMTSLTIGTVPRGKSRMPMRRVGMSMVPVPARRIVPLVSSHWVISAVLPRILSSASVSEIALDVGSMSCVICRTRSATGIDASDALRMPTRPLPVRESTEPVVEPANDTTPAMRPLLRGSPGFAGLPAPRMS